MNNDYHPALAIFLIVLWVVCFFISLFIVKPWEQRDVRYHLTVGDLVGRTMFCAIAGPIIVLGEIGSIRIK